jgi:GT2 family glycosyltransferase
VARKRPAVSVVVPFLGDEEDARALVDNLNTLDTAPGDELIVADNTPSGTAAVIGRADIHIVSAPEQRSSYHARNAGARAATSDWLLFIDADCTPSGSLLASYFAESIPKKCGAIAGGIVGIPSQRSLVARYTRERRFFDQTDGMHAEKGGAATGNLLVRRAAFESVNGFTEGIRSGGDVDFSWRVQNAGWTLERRPEAFVEHRHREGLASLMGAIARYGAGASWLNERYPGSADRWPLMLGLQGTGVDIARLLARGKVEAATFRAIDGLGLVAHNVGYRTSNSAK